MARGHGRILTNIWEDSDFIALTQEQQRLYLFLISQPNLNHAGLLPLTLRRWSRKAGDLSVTELDKHIAALDDARFVVVDDDTEELLVRSFVRNDGVWKQPRVMGAMVSAAEEISSRKLRAALLAEVSRIPMEELSDEPGAKNGPSIRAQVAEHIKALRKAIGTPSPTPPEGPHHSAEIGTNKSIGGESATPSGTPSATPSKCPAEGHPQGSTHVRDARADAGAHDARAPLPLSPIPSPITESGADANSEGDALVLAHPAWPDGPAPETARPVKPKRATGVPTDFTVTEPMRNWALAKGIPLGRIDNETERFLDYHRAKGSTFKDWTAAWRTWMNRAVDYAPRQATGTGGHEPYRNPTDQSAYDEDPWQ